MYSLKSNTWLWKSSIRKKLENVRMEIVQRVLICPLHVCIMIRSLIMRSHKFFTRGMNQGCLLKEALVSRTLALIAAKHGNWSRGLQQSKAGPLRVWRHRWEAEFHSLSVTEQLGGLGRSRILEVICSQVPPQLPGLWAHCIWAEHLCALDVWITIGTWSLL